MADNRGAQYNSDSMVQMLQALGQVLNVMEQNAGALAKTTTYFTAADCPIGGADSDAVKESFAFIQQTCNTAIEKVELLKNVLEGWASKMNISMEYAAKNAEEARKQLELVRQRVQQAQQKGE